MARPPPAPDDGGMVSNLRWSRTEESGGFFVDEDRLRGWFCAIAAASAGAIALLAAGLWRLQRAALAPPVFIGVADGRIFTGRPEPAGGLRDDEFDPQLRETVEVLFSRTEKGLPPVLRDFVAAEVLSTVDADYRDAAAKYPAGYAQTLAILEAKLVSARPGSRRMRYRGLLSSRSLEAAQTSPVYLECLFTTGRPSALNAAGWRLVRLTALGRDDYYQDERQRAVRRALQLP